MSRLTLLHINIIGAVATLLLAIILFFVLIKPKQDDIATTNATLQSTIQNHGTSTDVTTHKADLKKAQEAAKKTEADWKQQSVYYMPTLPYNEKSDPMQVYFFQRVGRDRSGKDQYGLRDLPTVYGSWITAWYDAQRNSGIARLPGTEFPIEPVALDPNGIATLDHLTFPRSGQGWPVAVEAKNFDDAMAHLRRFNTMQLHGMPVISNVALSGQSPHLTMTYSLSLYIIPGSAPPPADPRIGQGGVTGGSATGAGMMGMPGMPPAMMGRMGGGMPGAMSGSMPMGSGMPMGGKAAAAAGGKGD